MISYTVCIHILHIYIWVYIYIYPAYSHSLYMYVLLYILHTHEIYILRWKHTTIQPKKVISKSIQDTPLFLGDFQGFWTRRSAKNWDLMWGTDPIPFHVSEWVPEAGDRASGEVVRQGIGDPKSMIWHQGTSPSWVLEFLMWVLWPENANSMQILELWAPAPASCWAKFVCFPTVILSDQFLFGSVCNDTICVCLKIRDPKQIQ